MADLPTFRLITGDCIEHMAQMDEASVDAIVTDPPYGLEFMGKEWDRLLHDSTDGWANHGSLKRPRYEAGPAMQTWHQAWATEALRVLKPGGHLLAFGGTRTYHRLACAIEDAGFEIRDCLAWMYGSGFPKSLDVSKAIDKAAGAGREVVGTKPGAGNGSVVGLGQGPSMASTTPITAPATPEAQRWQGWGTALKPAYEPIVLARKPLAGTVAGNVQAFGTGAINVDGCRIGGDPRPVMARIPSVDHRGVEFTSEGSTGTGEMTTAGRWPANVLLDEQAAAEFPESRYFYTAKASSAERNRGVEWMEEQIADPYGEHRGRRMEDKSRIDGKPPHRGQNTHPTVKPVDLMQWLCRLITPTGGTVLDPFTGSGSTGMAALREGFTFIGIEREPEYVEIARARIVGDAPLFNVEDA